MQLKLRSLLQATNCARIMKQRLMDIEVRPLFFRPHEGPENGPIQAEDPYA
jgi:hypothetical protein